MCRCENCHVLVRGRDREPSCGEARSFTSSRRSPTDSQVLAPWSCNPCIYDGNSWQKEAEAPSRRDGASGRQNLEYTPTLCVPGTLSHFSSERQAQPAACQSQSHSAMSSLSPVQGADQHEHTRSIHAEGQQNAGCVSMRVHPLTSRRTFSGMLHMCHQQEALCSCRR